MIYNEQKFNLFRKDVIEYVECLSRIFSEDRYGIFGIDKNEMKKTVISELNKMTEEIKMQLQCIDNNMKDGDYEKALEKIWCSVNSFEKICQLPEEELYDIFEYKSFEQLIFIICYLGYGLK